MKQGKHMRASMYSGDMLMQGPLSKFSTGYRKRWLPRFFALRGHYLKYFPDDKKTLIKGTFDCLELTSATLVGLDITLVFSADSPAAAVAAVAEGATAEDRADAKAAKETKDAGKPDLQVGCTAQ